MITLLFLVIHGIAITQSLHCLAAKKLHRQYAIPPFVEIQNNNEIEGRKCEQKLTQFIIKEKKNYTFLFCVINKYFLWRFSNV